MISSKSLTGWLAALAWLPVFLPVTVQADDECQDFKKTVRNMIRSLDRSVPPGVQDGRFRVQEISRNHDRIGSRVTYYEGGKTLYEKRIPAHNRDLTTHFALGTLDGGKAVIYHEAYGMGNGIQCSSILYRRPTGFASAFVDSMKVGIRDLDGDGYAELIGTGRGRLLDGCQLAQVEINSLDESIYRFNVATERLIDVSQEYPKYFADARASVEESYKAHRNESPECAAGFRKLIKRLDGLGNAGKKGSTNGYPGAGPQ